ncbi:MAG TPA: type II secretion system F family protein [Clostridia bacterium]|nr:type II secretion system F family protein [Clostridia bacterium]
MQNLAVFAQQTGALLETGLPLLTCLELVKEQLAPEFRTALAAVQQDLREGCSLSAALRKHPQLFPPLAVSLLEAGELGGILAEVLRWMSQLYEQEVHWLEKVKSALLYPALVLVMVLLSLVFLFTVVVPQFTQILEQMGAEAPWFTRAILKAGPALMEGGFIAAAGLIGAMVIHHWRRPQAGIPWRDRFLLRLPLIGELMLKVLAARFCRVLGALLQSGVPILQAIRVVTQTLGNEYAQNCLSAVEMDLQEGRSLGRSLAKAAFFPPPLAAVVTAGEESGQLPESLFKLGRLYEAECQRTLERVTILLEPVLVLLLGGLVGVVVMALLLPLFTIISSL